MDATEIEALVRGGGDPDATLEALQRASRRLELPIGIDRRLQELADSGLAAGDVLEGLAAFLSGKSMSGEPMSGESVAGKPDEP